MTKSVRQSDSQASYTCRDINKKDVKELYKTYIFEQLHVL